MTRNVTTSQERGALSERVMNEMRRLEEIRDQCCRLRESASADVAAERKVRNARFANRHKLRPSFNCRHCVKIELSCYDSSKK